MNQSDYELLRRMILRDNDLSESIRNINKRESPPIGARYRKSDAQSCSNGGTIRVDYQNQDYDPYSLVTTGASWLFTAPVSGIYQINGALMWAATTNWGVGDVTFLDVLDQSNTWVTTLDYRADINSGGSSITVRLHGATFLYIAKDDGIYLRAGQSSGGSLNNYSLSNDIQYNHVAIFLIK